MKDRGQPPNCVERFCYDGKVLSGTSCVTPGTAIPFAIGRMTVSNSVYNQRSVLAFDAMGRVLSDRQHTVTVTSPWTTEAYTFSYTYHRNGSLASQTYPSGKTINYTYDTNNRPETVSQSGGEAFVLSRRFVDHGGVREIRYGNFLRQKYCYNDRLQMTGTELTPHGGAADCVQNASNLITLNFSYGSASQNNGNIVSQTIGASADDVWQQYYTYDGTNRIAMASENAAISGSTCPGGATWCRKYGYDHFGNRWISASLDTLHMATPTAQSAVSLATNRLTSGTYDAAGNLTAQTFITTGGGSMAYDANNQMKSFTATGVSVSTQYDAAGRRVRKVHNGQTTIWVYDAFGKLAAEYSTENQPTPVGTYYPTTDHLGSTRLVTNSNGAAVKRQDFFAFGETIPASSSFGNRQDVIDGSIATYNASLSMRQQFTGQQRDGETGLDYFWARNMAAPLGRFLSMDPENAGAMPRVPQSWNGYAYVNNNPMKLVDPDGRRSCIPTNQPSPPANADGQIPPGPNGCPSENDPDLEGDEPNDKVCLPTIMTVDCKPQGPPTPSKTGAPNLSKNSGLLKSGNPLNMICYVDPNYWECVDPQEPLASWVGLPSPANTGVPELGPYMQMLLALLDFFQEYPEFEAEVKETCGSGWDSSACWLAQPRPAEPPVNPLDDTSTDADSSGPDQNTRGVSIRDPDFISPRGVPRPDYVGYPQ